MLPINKNYTPPSSPPSSPCSPNITSSSPASSPMLELFSLDSDPEDEGEMLAPRARIPSAIDPLSGSYNAQRLNYTSHSMTNCGHSKKLRTEPTPAPVSATIGNTSPETGSKREISTWETALNKVFDSQAREIDLNGCDLTSIPPQLISDLSKFVTLPNDYGRPLDDTYTVSAARSAATGRRSQFTRTHTAPVTSLAGLPRVDQNGKSISSSFLGASRDGLDVYLSGNRIRKLPQELWSLPNLRVLSLRNNEISYLPPEISLLKNLVTLNIAHNKLKFVPAELMQMKKLTTLNLFPNPFIPPPSTRPGRVVSQTRRTGSRVPALVEITLRILLSCPFANGIDVPKTKLEQMYELPLPKGNVWRPISAHLCHTLAVCVPGSTVDDGPACSEEDSDFHRVTGISICPNPAHGSEKPNFVHHSEERYTWEKTFPGIEYLGGPATVLWRGCQHGCLRFLDAEDEKTDNNVGIVEDEAMEVDVEEEVVRVVHFAAGVLGFD